MSFKKNILKFLLYPLAYRYVKMPGRSYPGRLPSFGQPQELLRERLTEHVETLAVQIGERSIGNYAGMLKAIEYIEREFKGLNLTVERQNIEFDGKVMPNLIVEIKGSKRPDEIVIVGAHYDTVNNTPGADDNATGVAAMLELCRIFSRRSSLNAPERTIRFIAFANEEHPGGTWDQMGSFAYAKRCRERKEKIVGMLSLEMLGVYSTEPDSQHYPSPFNLFYPTVANFLAFVGNDKGRKFVRRCVEVFRKHAGLPSEGVAAPSFVKDAGRSDHWAFWQHGYDGVMVTDTSNFRYPLYHTPKDTIDRIDFTRMTLAVDGIMYVIEDMAKL